MNETSRDEQKETLTDRNDSKSLLATRSPSTFAELPRDEDLTKIPKTLRIFSRLLNRVEGRERKSRRKKAV